ncbi:MAG: DUF6785 family protein [Armatimonadota bacterium]
MSRSSVPPPGGVTARALLISFLLIPLNVFFVHGYCWVRYDLTGWDSVFETTVAGIFVLSLLSLGVRRWRPSWAFSAGEMLTIYVLLAISTSFGCVTWSLLTPLAGTISYPFWFATPENRWSEMLWPVLPDWLTVRTTDILEGYYVGGSSLYSMQVVRAWIGPVLWWTSFATALFWVTLCLNSIVRRRWEEEEKLPFPLVTVPVHIADQRFALFRSPLFWIAVLACMAEAGWNLAASYVPALPAIHEKFVFEQYVAQRHPWDKIPIPVVQISPLYMGLIYLIPLDLTFSLFFFDVLWDVQYVLAGWLGWNTRGVEDFPYGLQQSIGGFLAIVALAVYLDRGYFVHVLAQALGFPSRLKDQRREALGYRTAALGAAAGVAYLWWFLAKAGMSGGVAGGLILLYFAMAFGLSRLRGQLGPPNHALDGMMPNHLLGTVVGTRVLGPANVAVMGLLGPFLQGQHSNPAPLQLEALKMAEGGRLQRRRLAAAMALAVPLTVGCYFWANLHYGYRIGLSAGTPNLELVQASRGMITNMDNQIRFPTDTNVEGTVAVGAGFLITVTLMLVKLRLSWWPIHPAAFPLTLNYVMEEQAVTLFLIWLTKLVLLRYGGLRAHRTAQPFFIGLVVGTAFLSTTHAVFSRLLGGLR